MTVTIVRHNHLVVLDGTLDNQLKIRGFKKISDPDQFFQRLYDGQVRAGVFPALYQKQIDAATLKIEVVDGPAFFDPTTQLPQKITGATLLIKGVNPTAFLAQTPSKKHYLDHMADCAYTAHVRLGKTLDQTIANLELVKSVALDLSSAGVSSKIDAASACLLDKENYGK